MILKKDSINQFKVKMKEIWDKATEDYDGKEAVSTFIKKVVTDLKDKKINKTIKYKNKYQPRKRLQISDAWFDHNNSFIYKDIKTLEKFKMEEEIINDLKKKLKKIYEKVQSKEKKNQKQKRKKEEKIIAEREQKIADNKKIKKQCISDLNEINKSILNIEKKDEWTGENC